MVELKCVEEKIKEAEDNGKVCSLDECVQTLTEKVSKQESQETMMIAIDKLSNAKKGKKLDHEAPRTCERHDEYKVSTV